MFQLIVWLCQTFCDISSFQFQVVFKACLGKGHIICSIHLLFEKFRQCCIWSVIGSVWCHQPLLWEVPPMLHLKCHWFCMMSPAIAVRSSANVAFEVSLVLCGVCRQPLLWPLVPTSTSTRTYVLTSSSHCHHWTSTLLNRTCGTRHRWWVASECCQN